MKKKTKDWSLIEKNKRIALNPNKYLDGYLISRSNYQCLIWRDYKLYKLCKVCKLELLIDKFRKNFKSTSGFQSTCRSCEKIKRLANEKEKET